MTELPAVRFLRTLCAAVLREAPPAEAAARAHAALRELWTSRRSLVLEVQFTGFVSKGERIGAVEPAFLRGAGQLIVHRVSLVGFTPEAREEDLATLFTTAARPPAELGAEGIVGAIRAAAPRGIYVSTSTGQVYKPAPAPSPEPPAAPAEEAAPPPIQAPPAPAAIADVPPADAPGMPEMPTVEDAPPVPITAHTDASTTDWNSGFTLDLDEGSELSSFEIIDDDVVLAPTPAAGKSPSEPPPGEEPGANDMYHIFRASSDRADEDSDTLPRRLREAENMARFDDLAESCARSALRHLRAGDHLQAVALLEALATEAERPDRTRLFRESAAQALRSVGTAENLPHVVDLLQFVGNERERVLHVLFFLGGEAVSLLESHLFRTPDAEVRRAIFRRLIRGEGAGRPTVARALADSPARARTILELVTIPEVDTEQAARWTAEAAAHADATVRTDAARTAAALGGRGGLRILVDLLADADRGVRRAALHGLASLKDPAAIPFLTRFLNDSSDDDLQLGAIAALGRTGSAEALPPLLAIVNRRQLFGGRKAKALKLGAIEAIGLTGVPAARDVLASITTGSDADLAAEARRILATGG
ncbi:MAG TPA: HEAT repeat domain-containing protein [Longimicrobium sp.]